MRWYEVTECQHCGKSASSLIMSMFDERMICSACKEAERKRPDYHLAEAADLRAYAAKLAEPHRSSVLATAERIASGEFQNEK